MHLPSPLTPRRGDLRRRLHAGYRAAGLLLAIAALPLVGAAAASAASPTAPPPVSILTSQPGFGQGDIFITPTGDSTDYANGPEILDSHGNVVWFHAIPQGQTAADFRVQRLYGQPVLTWWQGTNLGGPSDATTTSTTPTTSR